MLYHGSKLDALVWEEFSSNWEDFSYQASGILANLKCEDIDRIEDEPEIIMLPEGRVREQLVKNRIGQYFFRVAVLNSYENRCCITGLAVLNFLWQAILSHGKTRTEGQSGSRKEFLEFHNDVVFKT